MKTGFIATTILAGVIGTMTIAQVQAAPRKPIVKKAKADTNNNGRVSAKEYAAAKKAQAKRRAVVSNPYEAKIDKNNNGIVQPKEAVAARSNRYLKNGSEVDKKWEEGADTDGDGVISREELKVERQDRFDRNDDGTVTRREIAKTATIRTKRVDTKHEEKYDADGNGFIDKSEGKEMLRDRLRVINTNGRAKVNTELEQQFDANGDGVIDREEAVALREAVAAD